MEVRIRNQADLAYSMIRISTLSFVEKIKLLDSIAHDTLHLKDLLSCTVATLDARIGTTILAINKNLVFQIRQLLVGILRRSLPLLARLAANPFSVSQSVSRLLSQHPSLDHTSAAMLHWPSYKASC